MRWTVRRSSPTNNQKTMRLTASALLAVFALAVPAVAQTKGQEVEAKANTEKLWRIECSGISG